VIAARGKRYLMLNAPDSALQAVIDLLPGLESPTVLPLARAGMHAVHAVVDRQQVVELLGPLRGAGASSILVLPIENLVP
jgi:ATP phosphoribosyltransferase